MRTPARVAKHPIHPMLVPIPIGLWIFSLVCDVVFRFGGGDQWETVALYTMVGGIVGALIAAIPGVIDVLSLPPQVRHIGFTHMALNLTVVALYAFNAWFRRDEGVTDILIGLSVVSIVMLGVSGWLGGEMVYAKGVGVEPGTEAEAVPMAVRNGKVHYLGPERRSAANRSSYSGPNRRVA